MAPIATMAPGPTLASQRFYNNQVAPALANAPSNIKCVGCQYVKPKTSYSKNKLLELGMHMRKSRGFDPKKDVHVTCINCTGGQKVEMRCAECGLWKGKNSYNKTQWKKDQDEAICEKCCEVRRNEEPGGSDDDEDDSGSDDGSSASGGGSSDDSDNGLSAHMGGASIRDGPGTFGSISGGTSCITSTNGASFSSASSTAGSRCGTLSSTAPSSGGSSKWAKIPAVKTNGNGFRKPAAPTIDVNDLQISSGESSDSD